MKNIQKITKYSLVLISLIASFIIPSISEAQFYYSVQATCYPNTYSAQINTAVGWAVSVSGGNGNYTYLWSGTDDLSGNSNPISKTYTTVGNKTASVTVVSAGRLVTANCGSVNVYPINYASLQVSCHPNTYSAQTNTQVGWSASGVGGNGVYTYSWSGTDGLYGSSNSILNTYTSEGTKTASITVNSSDGQTATANCGSIYVSPSQNYYQYYGNLNGSCSANVSSSQIGNTINWSGYASGGNGVYTYYWNDSDGYSSTGQYLSRYYTSAGNKYMNLTITSNGQSITRTCSVYVAPSAIINSTYYYPTQNQVLAYTDTNVNLDSVYLSDVPATGLEDIIKPILFALVLILWSAFLAFMFLKNKTDAEMLVPEKISKDTEVVKVKMSKDEKDIKQIEDYARNYKVLLSSEASVSLLKLSKLEKINVSEIIQKMAEIDWIAIGEKDLKKYI
ncbi:MAG: hypothetical protein WC933_02475 [Candidatus Paceibacterota bacterium]|jgi:hypothetical protein